MAEVERTCWDCQKIMKASIGQIWLGDRLRFSLSFYCPHCGLIAELDDVGFPPEDIRQAILAEEGEYVLKIDTSRVKNKVVAMKIIRCALELSLPEVLNLFNSHSKNIKGTKVEMQWL